MPNLRTFFKNLPIEKLLALLQWWLIASSKPQSHICDIFYLFRMHSIKFLYGPLLTFLTLDVTILSAKNHEIIRQKISERIAVGSFYWTHGQLASRFTKMAWCSFIQAKNTVISNPGTANYWKKSKNVFHFKHLCIHCTQKQILKWCPAHKGKNLDFIFIGSEVTTQTRLKLPITLWTAALRRLLQNKI